MLIAEFIRVYCDDIMQKYKEAEASGLTDKNYDEIIRNDDGELVKVVYAGDIAIDIEDIFTGDIEEFKYQYPGEKALEVYNEYRSHYTILEGLDAMMEEFFAMQKEKERIESDYKLYKELLHDDTTVSDAEGSELQRRLHSGGW